MNDFQDILRLFVEADDTIPTAGPRTDYLRSAVTGPGSDPKVALKRWAEDHNKEYAVLKGRIHNALKVLTDVYNTLNKYQTTTAGQAYPPTPAKPSFADRAAQLASMAQAYKSRKSATPPTATPPTGGV